MQLFAYEVVYGIAQLLAIPAAAVLLVAAAIVVCVTAILAMPQTQKAINDTAKGIWKGLQAIAATVEEAFGPDCPPVPDTQADVPETASTPEGASDAGTGDQSGAPVKQSPRYHDIPNFGEETETFDGVPVKPGQVTEEMEKFLGEGTHTDVNPHTGEREADRIWSEDGKRSIRYGEHEATSSQTKQHYHEETWTPNPQTGKLDVHNNVRRFPNQPKPSKFKK